MRSTIAQACGKSEFGSRQDRSRRAGRCYAPCLLDAATTCVLRLWAHDQPCYLLPSLIRKIAWAHPLLPATILEKCPLSGGLHEPLGRPNRNRAPWVMPNQTVQSIDPRRARRPPGSAIPPQHRHRQWPQVVDHLKDATERLSRHRDHDHGVRL